MSARADLVVVGGGVVGLATAWQVARAGRRVTVVDPGAGEAASWVAAGMLAPASETWFGEEALLRLNLFAVDRFRAFAAALETVTGTDVGLRRDGTLAVSYDAGDRPVLARLADLRRAYGLPVEELDRARCRELEPFLSADVQGGVLAAGDWSVDNRRFLGALRRAITAAAVEQVTGRVARLNAVAGRVVGVTLADGRTVAAEAVVLAAGAWSGSIAGVPEPVRRGVRPVKGQLLRLRLPKHMPPVLWRTVRGTVRGFEVYLVPRADGEVVVGATVEERGFDRTVTAAAVHDLLRDAIALLPVLRELVLVETCVGLRPGTADNGPIVGGTDIDGLIVATGHYRNGILQSAATAEAVLAALTGASLADEWAPFAGRTRVP